MVIVMARRGYLRNALFLLPLHMHVPTHPIALLYGQTSCV